MKIRQIFAALSAFAISALTSVQAAVPTEASAAVTGLITDATTYVGSLWPLLVAVVIGFVFMKLFRKGISKAT